MIECYCFIAMLKSRFPHSKTLAFNSLNAETQHYCSTKRLTAFQVDYQCSNSLLLFFWFSMLPSCPRYNTWITLHSVLLSIKKTTLVHISACLEAFCRFIFRQSIEKKYFFKGHSIRPSYSWKYIFFFCIVVIKLYNEYVIEFIANKWFLISISKWFLSPS